MEKRASVLVIVGILVVMIVLLGGVFFFILVNDSSNDSSKSGVFCELKAPWKLCYNETVQVKNKFDNSNSEVHMYRCFKEDKSRVYYYEKNLDYGQQTWTFINLGSQNDEVETYYFSDGYCDFSQSVQDKDTLNRVYYNSEFSNETKTLNGYLGRKLISSNISISAEDIVNIFDYINREMCYPLVQIVNNSDSNMYMNRSNFKKDFNDNVFDLPSVCGSSAPVSKDSPSVEETRNEINTALGFTQYGLQNVNLEGDISFNKTYIKFNNDIKTDNLFVPGNMYTMYFSGVKGFEEFHPYGAPAAFVDLAAYMVLEDSEGNILLEEPNLFSTYVGGEPLKDAQYLSFELTLPFPMSEGDYTWKVVLTDNKNEYNKLTSVVNFKV